MHLTLKSLFLCCVSLSTPALAERAKGIDVYHGDGVISWPTVKSAGYSFAFCKATENTNFKDSQLANNMINAKNAGLLIGAYHFAHPEINSPLAEATYFYNAVKPYLTPSYLRPVLDLERGGVDSTAGRASLSQWALDFVADFKSLSGGIEPLLYTGHNYAKYYENASLNSLDIWYARYNGADPQTGNPGYSDTVLTHWDFWQYSSTGRVPGVGNGTSDVDMNVANGDLNFVRSFLIPEPASLSLLLLTLLPRTLSRAKRS